MGEEMDDNVEKALNSIPLIFRNFLLPLKKVNSFRTEGRFE